MRWRKIASCLALAACGAPAAPAPRCDVVVYGDTAAAVVAAVAVARAGKSVVLVAPSLHLGGMTSSGLGATDTGSAAAVGGIAHEFYRRVRAHYDGEDAWTWQPRAQFTGRGHAPGDDAAWTFEPHVAERVLEDLVREANVPVVRGARLDLARGAAMDGTRIAALRVEDGRTVAGRVFVDASYEGDLLAAAGVTHRVGREGGGEFGEELNGVRTELATHHQFTHDVDPFVVPGDPASGLLPGVQHGSPGEEGAGDDCVQAYCFRVCATDVAGNRRPWPKPADYDARRYELLLRNFAAGDRRVPWHPVPIPNGKTDSNNNFAVSTDHVGANHDYPRGSWAVRDAIVRDHVAYQQGLLWTLANDARVPEQVRAHFTRFGLARDEFTDNDNWPYQLYVREARRMVGAVVMTEAHVRGKVVVEDAVGLGAYAMDSHHVQRYVDARGFARNEGDVQVRGFAPYPIAYRAIVPRASECTNLLVPVCVSATHIAFGSIRMEPVFMVLGESAGIAAALAVERASPVQDVEYSELRARLSAARQILAWAAGG